MLEQVALHILDLFIPPHFHFLIMAQKPLDDDASHTLSKLSEEKNTNIQETSTELFY